MDGPINFSTAQKQGHFEIPMDATQRIMMGIIVTCALTGFYTISSRIFSFVRLIFSLFILPGKPLRSFGPKGSWAIVTGASDGIGREFALQLASKGFNILLVSRTQSKLDAVAQEVMHMNGAVRAETLAIDFVKNSDSDFDAFSSAITSKDVAILVNSAGVSHDIPVSFAETPKAEVNAIISTNCTGTLRVTQLVIPAMVKRKNGLILTMGSFAGLIPTPLLASYSGSKAFLQHWSSALGAELAPKGITVELVQSYLVTSAMSKVRKPSLLVPNARNYAKAALAKIGRTGGAQGYAYTSTPYWGHAVMEWALGTFAGILNQFVVQRNGAMHESIRKRALRKMERERKKGL